MRRWLCSRTSRPITTKRVAQRGSFYAIAPTEKENHSMTSTKHITAKIQTLDKATTGKRFRNILANSGELMESGEIRDLDQLYVMDFDGKLVKISDLNTDPEKQTEKYSVKAQADHGEVQGDYLVPSPVKSAKDLQQWWFFVKIEVSARRTLQKHYSPTV